MKLNPLHSLLIFRCSFIIAVAIITFMSLIDLTDLPIPSIWDKLEHASAFILLSYLLDQSFPQYHHRRMFRMTQMTFLLGYGIGIEWLQSFTPTREPSFLDIVADTVGIFIYTLYKQRYEQQHERQHE